MRSKAQSKTRILAKSLEALISELDFKIARNPTYADLLNLRGLALAYTDQLDAARDDLAESLRLNPEYHEAMMNLVWLHVQRNEPRVARAILESRHAERLTAEQRAHLEFLYAMRWETEEAGLALLQRRADPQPDSWLALDILWSLVRTSQWQRVDAHLARMISANSSLDEHFRAVGALRKAGVRRQGLTVWSSVYRGNPNLAALLRALSLVCRDPARPEADQKLLHWSVTLSLDVCSFWLAVGTQLDFEGREEEAEAALQRAQRSDAERVEPSIQLGILYASLGRPEDAVLELEKTVVSRPGYVDVRYLLGLLYEELGRDPQAEHEYRKALSLNPGYVPAMLSLGNLLEKRCEDREGVQWLEKVRSGGIESADLENRIAAMYERLGLAVAAREARVRAHALAARE